MRGLKYLRLVLLVLLAILFPLAMAFRQTAQGGIEGFVWDDRGQPIARASLQAFDIMHGGFRAGVSHPNGYYQILNLSSGRYSLWVEAKGYTSEWIPVLIVEEGQATRKDIRLKRELPTEETQPTH